MIFLVPVLVGLLGLVAGAWIWQVAASRLVKGVLVAGSTLAVFFVVAQVIGNLEATVAGTAAQGLLDRVDQPADAMVLVPMAGFVAVGGAVGAAMTGMIWGLGCGVLWLVALALGAVVASRRSAMGAA